MLGRHRTSDLRRTLLAGAVATTLSAAATAGPPPAGEPQPVHDAWIDGRLDTSYALNPHLDSLRIDTRVRDGVVTLSGTLPSEIDRDLAVGIAEGVEGVREVRDDLRVEADARGMGTAALRAENGEGAFPQWIRDATHTARVRINLGSNGNTSRLAIDVDTRNDVVTLSGAVASRKEKMLAEMIARNTSGISSVHNRIVVDAPPEPTLTSAH